MANSIVNETLSEARTKLETRKRELLPAMEELAEIEKALENLGSSPTRRRPAKSANGRRSENRAVQFIDLVRKSPGLTVSQAAERLGIQPNYLYRVARELVAEGQLRKDAKGYFPKEKREKDASHSEDAGALSQ